MGWLEEAFRKKLNSVARGARRSARSEVAMLRECFDHLAHVLAPVVASDPKLRQAALGGLRRAPTLRDYFAGCIEDARKADLAMDEPVAGNGSPMEKRTISAPAGVSALPRVGVLVSPSTIPSMPLSVPAPPLPHQTPPPPMRSTNYPPPPSTVDRPHGNLPGSRHLIPPPSTATNAPQRTPSEGYPRHLPGAPAPHQLVTGGPGGPMISGWASPIYSYDMVAARMPPPSPAFYPCGWVGPPW